MSTDYVRASGSGKHWENCNIKIIKSSFLVSFPFFFIFLFRGHLIAWRKVTNSSMDFTYIFNMCCDLIVVDYVYIFFIMKWKTSVEFYLKKKLPSIDKIGIMFYDVEQDDRAGDQIAGNTIVAMILQWKMSASVFLPRYFVSFVKYFFNVSHGKLYSRSISWHSYCHSCYVVHVKIMTWK